MASTYAAIIIVLIVIVVMYTIGAMASRYGPQETLRLHWKRLLLIVVIEIIVAILLVQWAIRADYRHNSHKLV